MPNIRRALCFVCFLMAGLTLMGCGSTPPKSAGTDPVTVAVPVAVGCVDSNGRPAPPPPLKQRYTREQWDSLAPGARANAVAAQAGERMNFEDRDRAATSACR
jgi:hypothetical protein